VWKKQLVVICIREHIIKPFFGSIENISIFKLSHEALKGVSPGNFETKIKGMWLLFLIMYDLQSMRILKKNTVCIINNFSLKIKHISKLSNHKIQILPCYHYNLPKIICLSWFVIY